MTWYGVQIILLLAAFQVDSFFSNAFHLRRVTRHVTVVLNNEASTVGAETLVHPMLDEESFLLATQGRVGNEANDLVARCGGCSDNCLFALGQRMLLGD